MLFAPLGSRLTRFPQHELADSMNGTIRLGNGNKLCRRDDAVLRMVPAQKRLERPDGTRFRVDERLEHDGQLAPLDRKPDITLKRPALALLQRHLRVEHDKTDAGSL